MTVLMPNPRKVPRVLMRREPASPFETGPGEFDLLSALRLVRRRLLTIMLISGLIVLAAVPVILGQKPVYHAESRLMVHAPLVSVLDTNAGTTGAALNTTSEMERLLSRRIAERVIRELHLEEKAEFNPALRPSSLLDAARGALRGLIDSGKPAMAAPVGIELIIPEYYRALDIGRDTGSDVIRIGFDSQDPELAAAVPNFLIQEHFDAFNDPWTRELVTWHPTVDPANGHLSLPQAPGLGIDLNLDAIKAHPYDPNAYLNVHAEGWEKRLGRREKTKGKSRKG